jgi:hypothetical protein
MLRIRLWGHYVCKRFVWIYFIAHKNINFENMSLKIFNMTAAEAKCINRRVISSKAPG